MPNDRVEHQSYRRCWSDGLAQSRIVFIFW
jgi:hypothetical protein